MEINIGVLMKLYLDIGNSKIKWSYTPGQVESLFYKNLSVETIVSAVVGDLKAVDSIVCSNVVTSELIDDFLIQLSSYFHCDVLFSKPLYKTQWLEICSEAYKNIGVDRWLAMNAIASQLASREILLVTLGTALTVDYISKTGKHLGGYIIPGLNICLHSLLNNTSLGLISDFKTIDFKKPNLACDTKAAINNGILSLYTSFLQELAGQYPTSQLVLSGGDAINLFPLLSSNWLLEPDLVIKGLYLLH